MHIRFGFLAEFTAALAGLFGGIGLMVAPACVFAASVEVPEIAELKPLYLETPLATGGKAVATIVVPASGCYDGLARRIVEVVKASTGTTLVVEKDDAAGVRIPLDGHVIALGNRSTNAFIGQLYDRYFTLLDLRYPGRGGYVVRTLHNPFGNGFNVVFAGASDNEGVARAVDVLVGKIEAAADERSIRLGRLAEIKLGEKIKVPGNIREVETWEASAGYGSIGYFGWNSLSKRMALHYMTGDPKHAREFLRLAFPDAEARKEIAEIDGERIEDKDHPLSGPYHYNAHMMILYWDLIEESPAFSDDERLRVTRAFAEQLNHWASEWAYSGKSTSPPRAVGSRHGQWAAVSLYCLARYLQAHYPDPVWESGIAAGKRHFSPLHRHAWVSGENDNLFWYNTAIAPIFTYLALTGDRVPLENGVLATLLRGQEILISGRVPDGALNSASIGFLHKAAYLTGDGRWLAYRERTRVDTSVFRVGQSFWPDERLKPEAPEDLTGKWTVHRLPEAKWKSRRSGLPLGDSFEFASFRTQTGAGGDYLQLDGFNGASRNPYHAFAILELRLAGYTLLKDYRNQVITRIDGLMEPKIAMDAALRRVDRLGSTAFAVAEVPNAAFANWRRTLIVREGRYAVIVDELTFREASPNASVFLEWETDRSGKYVAPGRVTFSAAKEDGRRRTDPGGQILTADPLITIGGGRRWTMRWSGSVEAGQRRTFFSLVGIEPGASKPTLECYRSGPHTAALALPQPAMVGVPPNGENGAGLAVLASDHLFATGLTKLASIIEAKKPVDVDWDLTSGELAVVATEPTAIGIRIDRPQNLTVDEKPANLATTSPPSSPSSSKAGTGAGSMVWIRLPEGRHLIGGAKTGSRKMAYHATLQSGLETARGSFSKMVASSDSRTSDEETAAADWEAIASARFEGPIVGLETVLAPDGPRVAVAEGKSIHLLTLDGEIVQSLVADGPIRMLRWWEEPKLLLAGCADEKVIAFDTSGKRRWEFVSEMDPAVFRAAKTYWFKSAPGHEGIHGLFTGTFLDGKSQAFVGSACTLEILDEEGTLLHRMPQFWGKVSTFCLVDGPQNTRNLLAARKYNGTNTVAMINSKSLNPAPRGFLSVPAGQTYMPGWSSMNRYHLFHADVDGDGTGEIIGEINGTWNRVCVWTVDGRPRHAANFGPGRRIPARTMRDLDLGDLQGDGNPEIVVATSNGMVVMLGGTCEKIWARRLASPAEVLRCLDPSNSGRRGIVLGCDDGRARFLDRAGKLLYAGPIAGRPTAIRRISDAGGNPRIVFGTRTGGVSIFAVPR